MSCAETAVVSPPYIPQPNKCVMIIHTFSQWTNPAELRCAKICQLISLHLYKENIMKFNMNYFIILFDRYDIPISLKSATRQLWLGDSTL